ncbi:MULTISPECIES: GapA-binding peptide SR1P [Paenibacillus]|uniref:GapA-binding peptide SR1P n=1 Tax=Paenibacillus TaxID=44249 RepID=UPI0022B902B5|nr:GapA-binding peptide SR1P [Paenibacillus caseinilyticus]
MESNGRQEYGAVSGVLELGTIVCRHCEGVVDTLPTRRVQVFYGECDSCLTAGVKLAAVYSEGAACR